MRKWQRKTWPSWVFCAKVQAAALRLVTKLSTPEAFTIAADPGDLKECIAETGFAMETLRDVRSVVVRAVQADDVTLLEAVVMRNGLAKGSTARSMQLSPISPYAFFV